MGVLSAFFVLINQSTGVFTNHQLKLKISRDIIRAVNRCMEVLMYMDKKTKRSGMDFLSALTLIFVVLKATGLISWSWWWVLSPIWITFLFFAVIFSAILIGGRIVKGKW